MDLTYINSFSDANTAKIRAMSLYNNSDTPYDVIYAVAGAANVGVFEAATEVYVTSPDRQPWAIGVDQDQYYDSTGNTTRPRVLTSMLKKVGKLLKVVVGEYKAGTMQPSGTRYGLDVDAVGLSMSNPAMRQYQNDVSYIKSQLLHDGSTPD